MRLISDEQIRFFDDQGYLICRGIIQGDELANAQRESQRLIDEILAHGPADKRCNRGPEGVPFYLEYLHAHPNDFSLRLLAHPFIVDALTRMVAPDWVPCYESLVFKLPGKGSSVPWHRDGNPASVEKRIFNVDIYLDKSHAANSCVWVIPGSQRWDEPAAKAMITRGREQFELPDAVPAEVEPGDILFHHTRVLHGSTINTHPSLRRVIYFDNRTVEWNETYRWFHPDVMKKRSSLRQYAAHLRKTRPYPGDGGTARYTPGPGLPVWQEGEPVDLLAERKPYPR